MEHIWKVYELNRTIADGVVNKVTYACESTVTSGSEDYSTRKIGEIELSNGNPSDGNFIPFENLTEGDVLAWVTGSIDYESYQTWNSASLTSRLVEIAGITEATGKPWDNVEDPE